MQIENNQKESAEKESSRKKSKESNYIAKFREGEYKTTHLHTGEPWVDEKERLPDEIVAERKGSNCAFDQLPLELLEKIWFDVLKNPVLYITNHAREGSIDPSEKDPEKINKKLDGIIKWFAEKYLNNPKWIKEKFNKTKEELTEIEKNIITKLAEEQAQKLMLYGNERLEKGLKQIESMENDQIRPGLEMNIIPILDNNNIVSLKLDGEDFINKNKDQIKGPIIGSIHPETNSYWEKFTEKYYKNPEAPELTDELVQELSKKFTNILLKAADLEKINILAHPHYKILPQIIENLDWDLIAKNAAENKVAIEINIQDYMKKAVNKVMTDIKNFPLGENDYIKFLENNLNTIPLISSDKIMKQLKPRFQEGLKIAINTDEHRMFYQPKKGFKNDEEKYNQLLPEGSIKTIDKHDKDTMRKQLNIRFWRSLKILEQYFNEKFLEYGIQKENIINLYPQEKLEKFLKKEN